MDEYLKKASKNGSLSTDERLGYEIAVGIHRIADAIEKQAAATLLLARATAGEFDEPDQVSDPASPGQGMGMGG